MKNIFDFTNLSLSQQRIIFQRLPTRIFTFVSPTPTKPQVGDIDFYLEQEKYTKLKQSLLNGKIIKGARTLPNRPDLDLIELYDPDIDALSYIGNKKWQ